jgi:hypothetical protein
VKTDFSNGTPNGSFSKVMRILHLFNRGTPASQARDSAAISRPYLIVVPSKFINQIMLPADTEIQAIGDFHGDGAKDLLLLESKRPDVLLKSYQGRSDNKQANATFAFRATCRAPSPVQE